MREAKRRGISMDELQNELSAEELLAIISKVPDVTRWGLVPNSAIITEGFINDPALKSALAAVQKGSWEPAAELLSGTETDWDRRYYYVEKLAKLAADNDSWLKEWRSAKPEDPGAAAVYADSLAKLAWQIRGGLVASETGDEQFAGFFRTLQEAQEATQKAIELAPEDPTPWATLITIARGLSTERTEFEKIWLELVTRAPHHRAGHDQALQYWCAKWHGSDELMFAFASEAAKKTPALSALPLQAAFEYESTDQKVWQRKEIRHAVDATLRWVAAEGKDSLFANNDRSFAAVALVENKRFDEAVQQFRIIGPRADSWVWHYSTSPKMRFMNFRNLACKGAKKPREA